MFSIKRKRPNNGISIFFLSMCFSVLYLCICFSVDLYLHLYFSVSPSLSFSLPYYPYIFFMIRNIYSIFKFCILSSKLLRPVNGKPNPIERIGTLIQRAINKGFKKEIYALENIQQFLSKSLKINKNLKIEFAITLNNWPIFVRHKIWFFDVIFRFLKKIILDFLTTFCKGGLQKKLSKMFFQIYPKILFITLFN